METDTLVFKAVSWSFKDHINTKEICDEFNNGVEDRDSLSIYVSGRTQEGKTV